jgi:autotransporter-associated beta strand protein
MAVLNLLATQNATLAGGIFLSDDAVMNVQSGATLTLSGSLTGGDTLNKNGNGTLVLNGNNPFTSLITVNAGTLIGASTSLQGPIQNNGTVEFYQNTNGTMSNSISGTGSVTKSGSGGLTLLNGSYNYSGAWGEKENPGGEFFGQPVDGGFSVLQRCEGWLRRDFAGGLVSCKRLWAFRHGRKCLELVRRPLPRRHLRHPRR